MAKEKVSETTIRELCKKIASNCAHLLVCDEDAVVIYQDLIGHATVEENKALANDPALMETFYRIYGVAYGTVAAIKFYMDNSNRVYNMKAELEDYKEEYEKRKDECEGLKERITNLQEIIKDKEAQIVTESRDKDEYIKAIEMLRKENIELKAKLYDMLNSNG